MRAEVLDEPDLEFGGGNRHIDPRFGIANYGPADLGSESSPRVIRVGLVGPADQLDGLRRWAERCREPIPAKDEAYPHLFPAFPGCDIDVGLHTSLVFSDRWTRQVSGSDLRKVGRLGGPLALRLAVDAYAEEIDLLGQENRTDLILVARPTELADSRAPRTPKGTSETSLGTGSDESAPHKGMEYAQFANFHDLLKARLLSSRQPIQIIRRSTWDEETAPPPGRSRQDEATRAWNIHVAMYYKAGGVPWRLQRRVADLTTCYVGVAFYRSSERDVLDTSVAQVFNERGDGVIVRGGPARVTRDDRQPHLDHTGAHDLLVGALEAYRSHHRTLPARVVLHKTSSFTPEEAAGFQSAADDERLAVLDLAWVTNSDGARVFRPGAAPPLRGTLLELGDGLLDLYTGGSVPFYSTYPGMFVPRPVGVRPVTSSQSPRELAAEFLALTKMNWNQTRLDGRLPVTLRTANQVKSVLRFCGPEQTVATRYAHYM